MTVIVQPAVSVVIPVYNGQLYLKDALDSVRAQTYPTTEIIVVDDGSTDHSCDVARCFSQVQILSQPHQGAAAARNHGIQVAQGEYIAFLDADDLWLPEKLARQMQVFTENPHLELSFTHVQQFQSPDLDVDLQLKIDCPQQSMAGLIPSTLVIRKKVFDRLGLFNTSLEIGEFIDWYAHVQEAQLEIDVLADVLAHRRIHANNSGIRLRHARSDYLQIVKTTLDRRRLQAETGAKLL